MDEYKFETEMSAKIFESKYMFPNETTYNEPVERILAVVQTYYPEIISELREALYKKWIAPAGGLWRSAGNPNKNVSSINCTTLDQPEDTLESIATAWYWWAKFSAYGQGEGIDLSKLRPEGALVHNSAQKSTGAVSFMHTFDKILSIIAQQGRRGASLISLHIKHPDIPKFITIKDKEGVLESANISIHITDEFMNAVKNGDVWKFEFTNEYETIEKEVDARELFTFIAEHAWKSGDPGVQFIDTVRKESNSDYLGYPVISTNAPVTGDTLVPTKKGIFSIETLYNSQEEHEVLYNPIVKKSAVELKKVNRISIQPSQFVKATFNKYENQQVYNIELKGYGTIRSNKEHKWFTKKGYKSTQDLTTEDAIIIAPEGLYDVENYSIDKNSVSYQKGIICGWLTGDGWISNEYSHKLTEHKNIGFIFRKGYEDFVKVFNKITRHTISYTKNKDTSLLIKPSNKAFISYVTNVVYGYNNNKYHVPQEAFKNVSFAMGFLSALFQTNGSIDKLIHKTHCITLISTDLKFCEDVNKLLLMWFGIKSSIGSRKSKGVPYTVKTTGEKKISNFKPAYSLTIGTIPHVYKFLNTIGFLYGDKKEIQDSYIDANLMAKLAENTTPNYLVYKVSKVEQTNKRETMYCANIPDYHSLSIGGLVSSNCSEQWLDPHNVCLLSSINLAKFYEYGKENYPKIIALATYMLDAFRRYEIDGDRSPSPIQKEKLINLPRIGLGVTGLADYFFDKEIVYASKKSIEEVHYLFSILASITYKTSYKIAKKDGFSFKYYNKEKYKQSPFVQRLLRENLIEDYHLDCQAHVCKTTVAPNGSVTEIMEAGGGGVEPVFAAYYTRRERATTGNWKEWIVMNHAMRHLLAKKGLEETKQNADKIAENEWWITAHKVDNLHKIAMMAEIQKYIDSAISITYNLPNTASVEDVKEIYFKAWESKVKAVSVYRDGSKTGIFGLDEPKRQAEKRPKSLPCDIYEMQVNKKRVIALVGLLHKEPYEVFLTDDPDGMINVKHAKHGTIVKVKTGQYDLVITSTRGEYTLHNISSVFDDEWGTLGRLVSMSFRHQVPLQFIVDQLNKTKQFNTFSKSMARVLKKYIKEGTQVLSNNICPECGTHLIFNEGCRMCPNCAYSACD